MPCVLWISGDFDTEALTTAIQLEPYKKIEKGATVDSQAGPKTYEHALCGFDVSVQDFTNLEQQVPDAISYLEQHYEQLRALEGFPGITVKLDFGYYSSFMDTRIVAQYDSLPAKLLKLAGNLNIDIELSQYWHAGTAEQNN